ncbi:hypothetical protein [Streptomyces sp. NPDC002845]
MARTPQSYGSPHARVAHVLRAVFDDIGRIRAHSSDLFATDPSTVPVRRNVVVWE